MRVSYLLFFRSLCSAFLLDMVLSNFSKDVVRLITVFPVSGILTSTFPSLSTGLNLCKCHKTLHKCCIKVSQLLSLASRAGCPNCALCSKVADNSYNCPMAKVCFRVLVNGFIFGVICGCARASFYCSALRCFGGVD